MENKPEAKLTREERQTEIKQEAKRRIIDRDLTQRGTQGEERNRTQTEPSRPDKHRKT